jgi:hypothetical protein
MLRKPGQDPEFDKAMQRRWERARALLIAQQDNGTELPVDKVLRHFHREFNGRAVQHGLRAMPSSFNVLEAFHEYDANLSVFRLRRQIDHIFSVPDFLDRVTLNDLPLTLDEASSYFEDGVIYTFENAVDPAEIQFSMNTGAQVGIGGVSIIKHGDEVSVLLLAGEDADLAKESKMIRSGLQDMRPGPGKERIEAASDLTREAVPLPSRQELWALLALTRFDLPSSSRQARYVMHDCGDSFLTITDDPDPLLNEHGEFPDPLFAATLKDTTERIRAYTVLFELCSTFLYLPAYFEKFGDTAKEERHKTRYAEKARTLSYGAVAQLCPGEERVPFRRVTVLASTGEHLKSSSAYFRGPSFHIEKSGYWRRLAPGAVGTDRHGQVVHGRTWVEKRLSWTEDDSPAAIALTRCSQEQPVPDRSQGPDPGWIYVMRSAAHPRNVFKIGLTRKEPEERAEKLSSATGLPDGLFVLHEWHVPNCAEMEAQIHARLYPYRVNPGREFFDLPLKDIVQVIEVLVAEVR